MDGFIRTWRETLRAFAPFKIADKHIHAHTKVAEPEFNHFPVGSLGGEEEMRDIQLNADEMPVSLGAGDGGGAAAQKGSRTRSPSFIEAGRQRSTRATGFWVGCLPNCFSALPGAGIVQTVFICLPVTAFMAL
jgi:hypothetical protein